MGFGFGLVISGLWRHDYAFFTLGLVIVALEGLILLKKADAKVEGRPR
jgi:hypothetical protein